MKATTGLLLAVTLALLVWSCDALRELAPVRVGPPPVLALNIATLTPAQQATLQTLISNDAITYDWLVFIMQAQIDGKVITVEDPPAPLPPPDPPPDPPPVNGTDVTLAWDAPTTNADGTPLEDLAGYNVHVIENASARTPVFTTETTHTVTLPAGTHRVWVTAQDTAGNRSIPSNELELSF